jgi:ABC-type sugar transport system ATPase subunit
MLKLINIAYTLSSNRPIIKNITLEVHSGQVFGILGPSGVGKSTLFRAIAGLIEPTEGSVLLDSIDITGMSVSERPISYLQQRFPLYGNLSVIKNVLVAFESMAHHEKGDADKKAQQMLIDLEITEEFWTRKPQNLSGGEAQRVALAKSLLKPCKVLMLDEPFSNIDKNAKRSLNQLIRDLVKKQNIATLYISHDESDLLFMTDQLIYMDNGKVVQSGKPKELLTSPVSSKVAAIGSKIGLQTLSTDFLKNLDVGQRIMNLLPMNCEKIGWRPDATNFLLKADQKIPTNTNITLGVEVTIEHLTEIGREIYYNLSINKNGKSKHLWHLEYNSYKNNKSYQIGESGVLLIRPEDLLFLDEGDNILPGKRIK